MLGVAGLAVLGVCGYWWAFTHFMAYDDEGYVLLSLRNYLEHGGLYAHVYSQYGPLPYVFYDGLTKITGLSLDSNSARWLTLVYWCGCAVAGGALAWTLTRNRLATASGATLTFLMLLAMVNEPIHPGGLLALIAALGAFVSTHWLRSGRTDAAVIGAIVAGTLLSLGKINVGGLFLLATSSWLFLNTRLPPRWRNAAPLGVALGAAAVPAVLMRSLLDQHWVAVFGFSFAACALAVLTVLQRQQSAELPFRHWLHGALASLLTATAILVPTWLRGTDAADLFAGIVLEPLRHPSVYFHPMRWPAAQGWLAGVILLLAVSWRWWSGWKPAVLWLAAARFALAAWMGWKALSAGDFSFGAFGLHYGLAAGWLMTVPLGQETAAETLRARTWLAWLALWQTLQAFPVAGSQTTWGGFLWVPIFVAGMHEAFVVLAQRFRGHASLTAATIPHGVLLLLAALGLGRCIARGAEYFIGVPAWTFAGANRIRPDAQFALLHEVLQRNVRTHANTLFSFPGQFSANLWSGRPTPTLANTTHWFSLLSEAQQRQIIDQLERDPRASLIVQRYLVDHLVQRGMPPRGPLVDHLLADFVPAFRIEDYEFWVKRGRTIAPIGTARLVWSATGGVDLIVTTDIRAEVGSIEVQTAAGVPLLRLRPAAESAWTMVALDADGKEDGELRPVVAATELTSLSRLVAPLPEPPSWPALRELKVVLYDRRGHAQDALRFAHY